MFQAIRATVLLSLVALAACGSAPLTAPTRPPGWSAPEVLVAPSSFTGVHGLAMVAEIATDPITRASGARVRPQR